jgi:nicotinamide-nucleotide amidase
LDLFPHSLVSKAGELAAACKARNLQVVTAESCTGGLIAACLTEVPGISEIYHGGFVTYANDAKMRDLSVTEDLLIAHGAVSAEVARAMAEGACARTGADIGIAVTGIAGPGGATPQKPVGLVHIAVARKGAATRHERHVFPGDRLAVRLGAVEAALGLALRAATAEAAS